MIHQVIWSNFINLPISTTDVPEKLAVFPGTWDPENFKEIDRLVKYGSLT